MSIGAFGGVNASAAGAPLSSTQGGAAEKAQKDASAQTREAEFLEHAEQSAGIGQTEEDQGASDRDADGRRLWERNEEEEGEHPTPEQIAKRALDRKSKDTTGTAGNSLDLTG